MSGVVTYIPSKTLETYQTEYKYKSESSSLLVSNSWEHLELWGDDWFEIQTPYSYSDLKVPDL